MRDTCLDLGCGTGEDAAIWRAPVFRVSRHRCIRRTWCGSHSSSRRIGCHRTIEEIHDLTGMFDGVISNFGALNCVPELSGLRNPLARLIRPNGHLAVCLMGRFCLSESLHFLRQISVSESGTPMERPGTLCATAGLWTVYYPSAMHHHAGS